MKARSVSRLLRPVATVLGITGLFVFSLALYPMIGKAYFPRTDPSQFVISVKAPSGTRLELTEQAWSGRVEDIVRERCAHSSDLKIIVSNIGTTPGFNSILNPNSCPSTAIVQVGLNEGHHLSSFAYMNLVRERLRRELPQVSAYFADRRPGGCHSQPGHPGASGHPGQRHGPAIRRTRSPARSPSRCALCPGVSDVLVPQDVDYPALQD